MQSLVIPPEVSAALAAVAAAALTAIAAWLRSPAKPTPAPVHDGAMDDVLTELRGMRADMREHRDILIRIEDRTRPS